MTVIRIMKGTFVALLFGHASQWFHEAAHLSQPNLSPSYDGFSPTKWPGFYLPWHRSV